MHLAPPFTKVLCPPKVLRWRDVPMIKHVLKSAARATNPVDIEMAVIPV